MKVSSCTMSLYPSPSRTSAQYILITIGSWIFFSPGSYPTVSSHSGEWALNPSGHSIDWSIARITPEDRSGSLEFTVGGDDTGAFFPVKVSFVGQGSMAGITAANVTRVDSGEQAIFSADSVVTTDTYVVLWDGVQIRWYLGNWANLTPTCTGNGGCRLNKTEIHVLHIRRSTGQKNNYVTLHLTTTPVANGLLELLLTVRHSWVWVPTGKLGQQVLTDGVAKSVHKTVCGSWSHGEGDERSIFDISACRSCIWKRAPSAKVQWFLHGDCDQIS